MKDRVGIFASLLGVTQLKILSLKRGREQRDSSSRSRRFEPQHAQLRNSHHRSQATVPTNAVRWRAPELEVEALRVAAARARHAILL